VRGGVSGFKKADNITNPELLELPVTVLVPAAVQDQITEENAGRIRARMITEGANAAVSPEQTRSSTTGTSSWFRTSSPRRWW